MKVGGSFEGDDENNPHQLLRNTSDCGSDEQTNRDLIVEKPMYEEKIKHMKLNTNDKDEEIILNEGEKGQYSRDSLPPLYVDTQEEILRNLTEAENCYRQLKKL